MFAAGFTTVTLDEERRRVLPQSPDTVPPVADAERPNAGSPNTRGGEWPGIRWAVVGGLTGAVVFVGLSQLPGAVPFPSARHVSVFLDAFWPQLIATLVAVAGGIPAGLYIERQIERHRDTVAVRDHEERVQQTRHILFDLVEGTLTSAYELVDAITEDDQNPFTLPQLGLSGWEVLRHDVETLLSDDMRLALADYFDHVAGLADLVRLYREATIRLASGSNDSRNRAALREAIATVMRTLEQKAEYAEAWLRGDNPDE